MTTRIRSSLGHDVSFPDGAGGYVTVPAAPGVLELESVPPAVLQSIRAQYCDPKNHKSAMTIEEVQAP